MMIPPPDRDGERVLGFVLIVLVVLLTGLLASDVRQRVRSPLPARQVSP